MEFNYKTITSNILKTMPDRTKKVLSRRFSLGRTEEGETLEAIGQSYKITRERVRQIEADGLKRAQKSLENQPFKNEYQNIKKFFEEQLKAEGGLKREDLFLKKLGSPKDKNYILFLLNLDSDIEKIKEGQNYFSFYSLKNKNLSNIAKKIVADFVAKLKENNQSDTFENLFNILQKEYTAECKKYGIDKKLFNSILELSKDIITSLDGQKIGLKSSPDVNPKTVRDKIVLVLKSNAKPMHFKEITEMIYKMNQSIQTEKNRKYKLHPQTVHNELIRNDNFVLIGCGHYALKEWGYEPGRVKDIIYSVLQASDHPLSKDEIIEQVKKQRIVKDSTIFLGLQNKNFFEKDSEGKYKIREA